MADDQQPHLSHPYEESIGPSSPVQQALSRIEALIASRPMPRVGTDDARTSTALLGVHWLHCVRGAGQLNGGGFHSAAVALFRPIEDTHDCFAAVSLLTGAAERWLDGHLKASDAAKLWAQEVHEFEHEFVDSLAEYRKTIRSLFNEYSHCSPRLPEWNLYFQPRTADTGSLELNVQPMVINANAHRIDAHLTACLWEFLDVVERAFSDHLASNGPVRAELEFLKGKILPILERHKAHGCFDVLGATELRRLIED